MRMLGRALTFREGLILQIKDAQGNRGEGEIAPLTGVHLESLEDVEKNLINILEGKKAELKVLPSVCFGLEMAWNGYLTKIQEQKFFPKKLKPLPVNALLTSDLDDLKTLAEQLNEANYKAVKMKVGVKSIGEEIKRILILKTHLKQNISLRLDANRAWTLDKALEFASGIKGIKIEYCEEPLKNPEQLESFSEKSDLPVALDETLFNTENPEFLPTSNIAVLILKPSRLGGWKSCQKWVDFASKNNLGVTFTSCLESGLGLKWIALMNASMIPEPTPAGLDTFQNFQTDVIDPPFQLKNGEYISNQTWPQFQSTRTEIRTSGSFDPEVLSDFLIQI